ncbi:phage replisome organizer N-terminal domain-containing protein [Veillonella magna]|uniref:Phage replisome organizer N-terminal domain-containing protein n=1 Tax=Veillonella magna TaxID=464322 RepID=A0ABS2GDS0_9FIRM|nr:phage replisome organizer N-terminal domain-containing protein [Veillonella magna]MBM6823521.1 phage replisome organizer N-terminal domain-containing protein [Veillonella magna]MBM6911865.1 phage replisome organizer N-terminal domain-containing protein [Veillonella magna]
MAEKRFYWLKLKDDFFNPVENPEIARIMALPGGAECLVAYLKLMLASVKNRGKIFLKQLEDTPEDELALMTSERKDIIRMLLSFCFKANIIEAGTEKGHSFYLLKQVAGMLDSETEDAARKRKTQQSNEMLLLPRPPQSGNFRVQKTRAKQWCMSHANPVEITSMQNNKLFSGYYYLAIKRDVGRCRQCGSTEQVRAYNYTGIQPHDIVLESLITLCDVCYQEAILKTSKNNHDLIMENNGFSENSIDIDGNGNDVTFVKRLCNEDVTKVKRLCNESVTNLLPLNTPDKVPSTSIATELNDCDNNKPCNESVTFMKRSCNDSVTKASRKNNTTNEVDILQTQSTSGFSGGVTKSENFRRDRYRERDIYDSSIYISTLEMYKQKIGPVSQKIKKMLAELLMDPAGYTEKEIAEAIQATAIVGAGGVPYIRSVLENNRKPRERTVPDDRTSKIKSLKPDWDNITPGEL